MSVRIDFMILANKQKQKMTESLKFITSKRQPGTSEVTEVKVRLMFVYIGFKERVTETWLKFSEGITVWLKFV